MADVAIDATDATVDVAVDDAPAVASVTPQDARRERARVAHARLRQRYSAYRPIPRDGIVYHYQENQTDRSPASGQREGW